MNLLSVENLSKAYGIKTLFANISFGINFGQKVALIAKNGSGKTTLLNILAGTDVPDSGKVVWKNNIKVAYLSQSPALDENKTIQESIFSFETKELKLIAEYENLISKSSDLTADELKELERLQNEIEFLNAWDVENNFKQILQKLNISDFSQTIKTLSGGQIRRVALAGALIQQPDFLILDEPTNHLDIEIVEWLENYLINSKCALLMVTHDRYFLDRVCNEIIELDSGNLYTYKGNYSYYISKKAEIEKIKESELEKARNLYKRELEWVRKMPKARGTKAKARLDAFEAIKNKAMQKRKDEKMELSMKAERMGSKIIELIRIGKSYGDKKIINDFSYVFKRKEKIGIIGNNGTGKSTFLNILAGVIQPDKGKVQTGETIIFGNYSQQGLIIKEDKRVIEVVKDIADYIPLSNGTHLSASQLLQRFMFTPDMQYNFVSQLSGGEKRRLFLCTVLIKNPNFLILDEPTNDLDILTLSALEEFLLDYEGCILIVSHDRYFIDKLVDQVFVFDGSGEIEIFPGNYSDYRSYKSEMLKKTEQPESIQNKQVPVISASENKKELKLTFKEKYEMEQLEKDIAALELLKKSLEDNMQKTLNDFEELNRVSLEYKNTSDKLDTAMFRWMELSERSQGI